MDYESTFVYDNSLYPTPIESSKIESLKKEASS